MAYPFLVSINLFFYKIAPPGGGSGNISRLQLSIPLNNEEVVLVRACNRYGHSGTSGSSPDNDSWALLSQPANSGLKKIVACLACGWNSTTI